MRVIRILIMGAAIGAPTGSVAVSQETTVGPPVLSEAYQCPDPELRSPRDECCRVTVTVDDAGKILSAKARCSFAPYEASAEECYMTRTYEPRIRTGGKKEGWTRTFQETHLAKVPVPFTPENLIAAGQDAEKRCDDLQPHT